MTNLYYPGYQTRTWNPLVGDDHGAKFGCLDRCWAAQMVARFGDTWGIGKSFAPRLIEKWLRKPLSWRNPQVVAMGFLGDIACLHGSYPGELVGEILGVIRNTPQHTYLLLTKDPARFAGELGMPCCDGLPPNVLMMATVRNQEEADRVIPALLRIPATRYGLSVEPLLGPVELGNWLPARDKERMKAPYLDWVATGCESGRGARWGECLADADNAWVRGWPVMHWIRSISDQCRAAGVPFFCKQAPVWQTTRLHGGIKPCTPHWAVSSNPAEFPEDLRVRETPKKGGTL